MSRRTDETPHTWFRSERVFRSDGNWFFHTREGIAVGPYRDKFSAEVDAEMLKPMLKDTSLDEACLIIKEFMLDQGKTLGGLNATVFTDYVVEEGLSFDEGADASP